MFLGLATAEAAVEMFSFACSEHKKLPLEICLGDARVTNLVKFLPDTWIGM